MNESCDRISQGWVRLYLDLVLVARESELSALSILENLDHHAILKEARIAVLRGSLDEETSVETQGIVQMYEDHLVYVLLAHGNEEFCRA